MGIITGDMLMTCGIGPQSRLIAALSGGADSVALLRSLVELRNEGMVGMVYAAHLHHGIRDAGADADATFCQKLCEGLDIPLTVSHADVPKLAKESAMTVEQAAREARRAFLLQELQDRNAEYIALGHHREDQAETVLMHLLRGSGRTGLTGMGQVAGPFVRPMLTITRAEIETYLTLLGQPYQTDETNGDMQYMRNRVRHQLMPLLRTFNPDADATLCKTAALLNQDERFLGELAQKALVWDEEGEGWEKDPLKAQQEPIRSRALRKLLLELTGDVTATDIQRVDGLLTAQNGTAIQLRQGNSAWVDRGTLHLGIYPERPDYQVPFSALGETLLPDGSRFVVRRVTNWEKPTDGNRAYLDGDRLPKEAVVRTRRPGDSIQPLGMDGNKLLSDWMTDKKIPRHKRDMPLVCSGNRVYYVAGFGISAEVRIEPFTTQILYLEYERDERE